MARRTKSLMQGSRKGQDGIVWHGEHRSKARRSMKGANRRMSYQVVRHGKPYQLSIQASKRISWQKRRFAEWKEAHPEEPNRKNPFQIPREEFKNFAFRDAFAAAGITFNVQQEQHTERKRT